MFKERRFSAHEDFRTGIFCKLSLFLGFFLLLFYVFLKIISLFIGQNNTGFIQTIYDLSQSSVADSIIAFSIVFLGVGFILYFFHLQFVKLSKIADEIENEEEIKETD
ncbi:MAG: hypothetical protein KAR64_03720 [Thermoplasmatales archaeon]|nr:hypothetical protein [Thermoplasmatales archaeon]